MSFLKKQKQTPEFINNYLKYKRFIEDGAQTTADESYYDLKALLRFVKLSLYDKNRLNTITKEEFKQIDIIKTSEIINIWPVKVNPLKIVWFTYLSIDKDYSHF